MSESEYGEQLKKAYAVREAARQMPLRQMILALRQAEELAAVNNPLAYRGIAARMREDREVLEALETLAESGL